MAKDLRQFLQVLKEKGPDFYVEVNRPLKPKLEVCILQGKLASLERFPVIYCPEIEGSKLPLVTNLLGSYELLGLALGINRNKAEKAEIFQEFRKREAEMKQPEMIPSGKAPIKEIVLRGSDVNLSLLPLIHHHELDSGKYISSGCMICKDPETGIPNVGIYRQEVKGKDRLGCLTTPAHHAAYIARRYADLGKPMEVAIFIGHHPAVILGACASGDLEKNELQVIGGLLQEPFQMTPAETVELPVPAYAEIIIEGVIDPRSMTTDGPFAEYTGYYGRGMQPCYLIQVTGITMRKDAIYHDIDPAHREHNLAGVLGKESEVHNAMKRVIPNLRAVHFPTHSARASATATFHMYVAIKKQLEGEGKFAGLAAHGLVRAAKLVVVVDDDIDLYNEQEVLWAIATRVVWDSDVSIIPRVTGAPLDPSGYDETRLERGLMTSKVIIDATKPVNQPFANRTNPNKELWDSMKIEDYLK